MSVPPLTLRPLAPARRARRAAVVAVTAGALVALGGALPPAAVAQSAPGADVSEMARSGPVVPPGSFIGPVHAMSPLHSARSTEPLARKFR